MDISRINALTPDEVLAVIKLQDLAVEAKEAEEVISATYCCFGIGEEKVEIWQDRDGYNFEYLTHDGVWQARYLHQQYDVFCSADGIFECLKAEYFTQMGVGNLPREIREMADACRYFRAFVKRTKAMACQQRASAFQG